MFSVLTPAPVYLQAAFKFGLWNGDVAPTQYYDPLNFTTLELTAIKQDNDRLLSNMEGSAGEALASIPKPTDPGTFKGELDTMTEGIAAILLGADVSALSQTGATITAEVITTVLNVWVPLVHQDLTTLTSDVTMVTSADAAIDRSKYVVDTILGMVKAIHSDAVGTGNKITYKTATTAGRIYAAGKAKSAYVKLVGTATEKVSTKRGRIIIHKVSLSASQAIDLVKGGYFTGTLAGDLLTPTGQNSPWEFTAIT